MKFKLKEATRHIFWNMKPHSILNTNVQHFAEVFNLVVVLKNARVPGLTLVLHFAQHSKSNVH